jgi:ankyrin repeat protein
MKSQLIAIVAVVLVVGCGGPPKTISEAADEGNIEAVKQYLDGGVDVNVKDIRFGWTPLHRAATTEIAELLIAEGADVNANDQHGQTPLHSAAWNSHKEIAELLISKGADVNAKGDADWTPLHWATEGGHKETVELLIAKGADVNAKISGGWTVLDEVTHPDNPNKNKAQIADLLRKHGGKTAKELKAEGK